MLSIALYTFSERQIKHRIGVLGGLIFQKKLWLSLLFFYLGILAGLLFIHIFLI
jgi:hypothetical protein